MKSRSKSRRAVRHGGHQTGHAAGNHRSAQRSTSHTSHAQIAEGIVSANRAGFGFVNVEGMEDGVFLPPPQMAGLMHGDRVRIAVRRDARGRFSGEVVAVLDHAISRFLGIVERQGQELKVRAADRRMNLYCAVRPADLAGAEAGDWVIAEISRYAEGNMPALAVVRERLDPERPVQMAIATAVARFGLPEAFGEAAVRDAERWGTVVDQAEAARRVDLRALPLVTIDGEDARDFDDAVYAERQGAEFRLLVAIADVSHYVRPGTALDAEARARGTSVYFPTRVVPMLPAALSDELCSLKPQVDRLCMVADMQISERGALRHTSVYAGVMRSAARLTYSQAHAALFERRVAERERIGLPLVERLEPLVDIYRALVKARHRRGALEFDAPEAEFAIDDRELVHAIHFRQRNDAHKLIEECMVLANVAVAQALRKEKVPALYRVHAPPEERKLTALKQTLRALNIEIQLPEEVQTRDLAAIAPMVRDPEARPFVETLVVRSLSQALYQPENIGHFGLALKDYAHFTSPIRRYPDLLVHRALRVMVQLAPRDSIQDAGELEAAGTDLSRLEKRADESDRYVDTFLKCAWLRDRIGQTFDGMVTTVTEFGCFVQLLQVGADGLLHLSALTDDEYHLSRDGSRWQGKRTARSLGPGTRLRVIVNAANPVEGLIDLALDDGKAAMPPAAKSGTRPDSSWSPPQAALKDRGAPPISKARQSSRRRRR
jgi:ribonuclease R